MQYTDRDLFLKWWTDAWDEGLWAAAWSRSIDGLTAAQAAWQPPGQDGRLHHSIWQIVEHMIFWRESSMARIDGAAAPSDAERDARNFPQPGQPTEAAWADTRRRFKQTHDQLAALVRDRYDAAAPLMWFLPHDSYHIGQINYLRGLMGLEAID